MNKIIRTPTRAAGGITPDERAEMDLIAQEWTDIALRTEPADPAEVHRSITALYAAADLPAPRVILVPSPLVMAMAGEMSRRWYATYDATHTATLAATRAATFASTDDATRAATFASTDDATEAATRNATSNATRAATDAATYAATYDATDDATEAATYDATDAATYAATYDATDAATRNATSNATRAATDAATRKATEAATDPATKAAIFSEWWKFYQGGNMWAYSCAYLAACRDVLGLTGLDCWGKYQPWEDAARAGGFRYMHEHFCMVSDFPERLLIDDNNQPHCEDGPSHKWRDGWSLYHWHGVKVPGEYIEDRSLLTSDVILVENNAEVRRALMEMYGMDRYLDDIGATALDVQTDQYGRAIELYRLPDAELPMVRVVNSSPEPDGHYKRYVLTATRQTRDALDALASLAGTTREHYIPVLES